MMFLREAPVTPCRSQLGHACSGVSRGRNNVSEQHLLVPFLSQAPAGRKGWGNIRTKEGERKRERVRKRWRGIERERERERERSTGGWENVE
jgi:hypothetical protein